MPFLVLLQASNYFFSLFFFFNFCFSFYIASVSRRAGTGQESVIEKLFKSPWNFIFVTKGTFFPKSSARLDCGKKKSKILKLPGDLHTDTGRSKKKQEREKL